MAVEVRSSVTFRCGMIHALGACVCLYVTTASTIGIAQEAFPSATATESVGVRQSHRLFVINAATLRRQMSQLLGKRIFPTVDDAFIIADRTGENGVQIQGNAEYGSLELTGNQVLVKQVVTLIQALDQGATSPVKSIVLLQRQNLNLGTTRDAAKKSHDIRPVQHTELAQAADQSQNLGNTKPRSESSSNNARHGTDNLPPIDPAIRQRLRDLGDAVQVEVLPDLDVVILRGRDSDIDELAKIIKQLEQMAADAQPQIEVYPLKHVSGEALSELIEEVSEDYTGPRQGRVAVTALSKPNALLLVGWGSALSATMDLIRKLDQPVAPEAQLEVLALGNASAANTATTVQDFFDQRPGLGPRVLVTPDQRTNSLIIRAAPRDLEEVRRLVKQLDASSANSVDRASVFQLRHALAADLATVLQNAIQNTQSTSATDRAAALEVFTMTPNGEQLVRSGDLANIQITPNPRTNALIVTGPIDSVRLLAALIQRLDVPRDTAQVKVFPIQHGDAASLVQTLQSLLLTGAENEDPNLPNAIDETSLTPLRFSVEDRTNSIVAAGSAGDLEIVEALLRRLDEPDANERINAVYHLKNAPAVDVARTINEFLRSERLITSVAQTGVNPAQQVEREVVVVPEVVSNKLVLSATPRYFQEVSDLIRRLDEAPPQVMIQVLIGEVALNNTEEFGIELGLQDSVLFDRSLLGDLVTTVNSSQQSTVDGIVTVTEEIIQAASNTPGFNFNNFPLGNSGSTQALDRSNEIGSQGLSSFAVGRVNNELGFGGLVLSASSENVSILIRALQESRRIEILGRPQIRTLDNQPAFIQVGQVVPYILNSTITQFGQTNAIAFRDVGLIIGVTPRISPDGTVVMEVDAEKSRLGPEEQGIPISAANDGTIIRAPTIDTTRAQTTVSAASGETIVLGGLITKDSAVTHRRVPYLSNIPLVGDLFRYDNTTTRRTELLIILTPHVIYGPADNERIKQAEMARMHWCLADVYELHGDVNYQFQDHPVLLDQPAEVIYPETHNNNTATSDAMGNQPVGENVNGTVNAVGRVLPTIIQSPLEANQAVTP